MVTKSKKQKIIFSRSAGELTDQQWPEVEEPEGELSIDVFQDKNNIYIQSAMAGVKPENLEISVHHDMVTIRGRREKNQIVAQKDYFYQECFWGKFSRSIILPFNIKTDQIKAEIDNGILTITLPKLKHQHNIPIEVKD